MRYRGFEHGWFCKLWRAPFLGLLVATLFGFTVLNLAAYFVGAVYLSKAQLSIVCYSAGTHDTCSLQSRFADWNRGVDFGISQRCAKNECK